jgi:hypothetical protein
MFNTVRDYLSEKVSYLTEQLRVFQSGHLKGSSDYLDSDLRRYEFSQRDPQQEYETTDEYKHNYSQTYNHYIERNVLRNEPYEFFESLPIEQFPPERLPAPGINALPLRYHKTNPVYPTESVPETGFKIHPLIYHLLVLKYPEYLNYVNKYVRPLGTTEATFSDFNREQLESRPIPPYRIDRIMSIVFYFLACTPYIPLHFVDFQYAKLPLHTGTGYYNRYSYDALTHAAYARNENYATRPTSKGYFHNTTMEYGRTIVHNIKYFGYPFSTESLSPSEIYHKMRAFFLRRPTLLFTRNHISDRDGVLKQRPVYAVDDIFIIIEVMLTFPLLVMARSAQCCILYGLETLRGSAHYLDFIAKKYSSYFSIDWSSYDQRLPRVITDLYYTEFLERLIVINSGYQPTADYQDYSDLSSKNMFERISNLLHFLHTWYNNMVYVTADGYAYTRTHCGVPSGLYNTQYLDSFGNLFLLIDAMIEYGFSDDQIKSLVLFVLGDDNTGFTNWPIQTLDAFINWFETYALKRYNMVLSRNKSVITHLRSKIESLSYRVNYGTPIRPLPKLVAQLCLPERGPKEKFMSARAIGIAYAAAGMNEEFHNFCYDVYHTFLPYAAPITSQTIEQVSAYLPGAFKVYDAITEHIDFQKFPTIDEVCQAYSAYLGPLSFQPKWNLAHFVNQPNVIPPRAQTLLEYRKEHNLPRKPVINYFKQSPQKV